MSVGNQKVTGLRESALLEQVDVRVKRGGRQGAELSPAHRNACNKKTLIIDANLGARFAVRLAELSAGKHPAFFVAHSWKHLRMSNPSSTARSPRFPYWLRRAGDIALSLGALVLLAASGAVDGKFNHLGIEIAKSLLFIVCGGALAATEAVLEVRRNARLARIEGEFPGLTERAALGERRLLELMREELKELARLARHFSNERVSLYRKDEDGFTLVARYSRLDGYEESLGREILPLGEGVIGKAWERGSAADSSLPSAGQLSGLATQQWLRAQTRWGVAAEVSRDFVMRSQAYAAFRLYGEDERDRGVLIFESTTSAEDLDPIKSGGPILEEETLEKFVKPASKRIATLLRFSHAISRVRVREVLGELQGPNRDRTA